MNELAVFDPIVVDITAFVKPTMALLVSDKQTMETALAAARQAKSLEKVVEDQYQAVARPLQALLKRIQDRKKEVLEPIEKAQRHCKGELIAYERKLEKERIEEQRKINEAARLEREALKNKRFEDDQKAADQRAKEESAANFFDLPVESLSEPTTQTDFTQQEIDLEQREAQARKANESNRVSGTQKAWTFEWTDERLIPREYCEPADKLIRYAIRAGVREIPGVRIFEETRMAIR